MPHPASGGAPIIAGVHKAIRLAYHGCTNRPFFHIVVMEARQKRDGLCIEQLGTYDPCPNKFGERLCSLNLDRIVYWLGKDVAISKGVSELLGVAGLLPIHPHTYQSAWNSRIKSKKLEENVSAQ